MAANVNQESVLAASVAMTSYRLESHDQLSPAAPGKVMILGGSLVDKTLSLTRMPPVGGDSYAKELHNGVGGCALNVAHILRQLELPHAIKVPIGVGLNAAFIEAQLKADGYNDEDFIKPYEYGDPKAQDCGVCNCFVDAAGERTFIVVPGIENHMEPGWLKDAPIEECDLIYLSGFDLTENNGMVYLEEIAARKRPDCAVYFDAGARVDFITYEARALLYKLKPILHLNLLELELLTGTKHLVKGMAELTSKTPCPVILTLAHHGCLLGQRLGHTAHVTARRSAGALPSFNSTKTPSENTIVPKSAASSVFYQAIAQAPSLGFTLKHYPTIPQKVLDATGAGDAHSAGIIAALIQGQTIDEGIIFGSKLAAKVVGQIGARLTI